MASGVTFRTRKSMRPSFFYGWVMLGVAGVCYSFGISPVFYGWGIFVLSMTEDLGIDRSDVGGVFGFFNVMSQGVSVIVGVGIARLGLRPIMAVGFLVTSLGMLYLVGAESAVDCYVGFSLLGGIGVGMSTIIPCQTLAQNWFLRRRALAIAFVFTAGAIVGSLVPATGLYIVSHADWREGWLVIAGVSGILSVLAVLFVIDRPEKIGQTLDGDSSSVPVTKISEWSALQAIKTRQFALLVGCGVAYTATWSALVPHLALHFDDMGYSMGMAGAFISVMVLLSSIGRLIGAVGDWLPPQYVLAVALAIEGLGAGMVLAADNAIFASLAVAFVGLGFGVAYVSVPVVFSFFFGRNAFAVTSGLRLTVTAAFSGLGPWVSGEFFDATGAYTIPFLGLMVIGLGGAVCAGSLKHPGSPSILST